MKKDQIERLSSDLNEIVTRLKEQTDSIPSHSFDEIKESNLFSIHKLGNKVYGYKLPWMGGLRLYVRMEPNSTIDEHYHSEFERVMLLGGECKDNRGNSISTEKVYKPEEIHGLNTRKGAYLIIDISDKKVL